MNGNYNKEIYFGSMMNRLQKLSHKEEKKERTDFPTPACPVITRTWPQNRS